MVCPKCKGEVIEIKGDYFCSQCGAKVDLEELEEELKEEIDEAKGGVPHAPFESSSSGDEPSSESNQSPSAPSFVLSSRKPKISYSKNIRILLILVITLNILILLGLVYFFVIK